MLRKWRPSLVSFIVIIFTSMVQDPVPIIRHNTVNTSFSVPRGKDVVFAIEGRDRQQLKGLATDSLGSKALLPGT